MLQLFIAKFNVLEVCLWIMLLNHLFWRNIIEWHLELFLNILFVILLSCFIIVGEILRRISTSARSIPAISVCSHPASGSCVWTSKLLLPHNFHSGTSSSHPSLFSQKLLETGVFHMPACPFRLFLRLKVIFVKPSDHHFMSLVLLCWHLSWSAFVFIGICDRR